MIFLFKLFGLKQLITLWYIWKYLFSPGQNRKFSAKLFILFFKFFVLDKKFFTSLNHGNIRTILLNILMDILTLILFSHNMTFWCFPLDLSHAIHIPFNEPWMEVNMLIWILGTIKSIHIQLPHKRCHVLMSKEVRQDLIDKSRSIENLETIHFRQPSHQLRVFRILSYEFSYVKDLDEFFYEFRDFSAPVCNFRHYYYTKTRKNSR